MYNARTARDLMHAFQIHYNFMRPHMALKNKTPAQAAELNLRLGHDKWKGLISRGANSTKLGVIR